MRNLLAAWLWLTVLVAFVGLNQVVAQEPPDAPAGETPATDPAPPDPAPGEPAPGEPASSDETPTATDPESAATDPDPAAPEPAPAEEPASEPADPEPTAETPAAAPEPVDAIEITAAFNRQFSEWKKIIAQLRSLSARYKTAKEPERVKLKAEYAVLIKQGEAMEQSVRTAADQAFAAEPSPDSEVGKFLAALVEHDMKLDRFEECLRRGSLLVEHRFNNPRIYSLAGEAAFALHDFAAARRFLKLSEEGGNLEADSQSMLAAIEDHEKKWVAEQAIRAQEAQADDLPRVKLTTTKGEIVVELFENEAPNTVANFISLVEKKFYDGLTFHRVLTGFVAQGGDPQGNGTGGPGYKIPCECFAPNHPRQHFRGSLSMAHGGRDTGGSQFFLTFLPTANLNGKHTVFGRIIEGIEILEHIQRRDPEKPPLPEPDRIVKAEVLRKRDHAYEPKKVE